MRTVKSSAMESVLADGLIGRMLDRRYHVRSRIAHGGMATVYLATDTRLDRQVAVKVMHTELTRDAEFVGRFIGEAKSVARLSHPNIVAVFDQGSDGQYLYLAMEYVPGRTLRSLLRERGRFGHAEALDIMDPILSGLAAAHQAGIVHRDVKPENVLLTADGRVKVVDFGLARAQAAASNTRAGLIIGTVAYIAPEQVTGGVTDVRTDVYAAGVMMWEMLTGRQPHTGDSPLAVAYKHVNSDVPAPVGFAPGLPPAVDQLVRAATSRDPRLRPGDASVFLRAVRVLRGVGDEGDAITGAWMDPGPGYGGAGYAGQGAAGFAGTPGAPGAAGAAGSHTMVVSGGGYATDSAYRGTGQGGYNGGYGGAGQGGDYQGAHGYRSGYRSGEPFLQRWLFSRRLALLAVAAAAVIAVGIGGWWLTSGRYTPLPSVAGMSYATAARTLQDAGFRVQQGTQVTDNNVPKGDVVSTAPSGRAVKGATIVLVVSSGPKMIVVPTVATSGQTLAGAIALLRQAGLTVSDTPKNVGADGVAVGSIAGTTPPAGTSWPANQTVYVDVVAGMALPSFIGQDIGVIQGWAQTNQISLSAQDVASNEPKGIIVSQSPAPGTPVKPGATVTVNVSNGPADVPIPNDLQGKRFQDVQQELQQLGFQVKGEAFGPGDRVFAVNPTGSAPHGSTIVVFYGGF
jgi:serine/threonine-protein kinase